MSFTGENLQNVMLKTLANISGQIFTSGTPIITYALNEAPGHCKPTGPFTWRITPVPTSKNLFTIQGVLTGLYAIVDGAAEVNKGIVTGVVTMQWEVNAIGDPTSHSVTISAPNTDLFWHVTFNALFTRIILAKQNSTSS